MNAAQSSPSPPVSHLELVRAAVLAPSPDNNQPWRFASRGEQLLVYLDPTRALPSDVHSMFDLMGIGAAIENAAIAARQQGYEAQVECKLPAPEPSDPSTPRLAAELTFAPGGQPDPLYAQLATRCTNRRLYSRRPIAEDALSRLAAAVRGFPEVQLDWVTDRKRIRGFARVVRASDRFRFEYEPFHKEIFRQLRFTAEEAEQTLDGLDIRTMELPPGAAAILKLLRSWKRMHLLHKIGLGRLLTFPSALSVWMSGALGALSLPEPAPRRFLDGGRAFQRIWLAAQSQGLALQPLGGIAVFLGQMAQLQGRNLTKPHQRLAQRLAERVRQLVPSAEGRTLLLLFRLGNSKPPTVRSLRRPAEDVMDGPVARCARSRP